MTRPASARPIVEGEFVFTAEDFRQIAALLHAHSGIALSEGKAALVYSRLAKRLRSLGLESFRDYCALVCDAEGIDELQAMTAALTTNVTRFFREPHHFEHLRDRVLPPLVQRARAGGRVRVWSAGCSNGQEPYTLAMTILALLPEAADLDVKILASDIDPNMVAEGRAGVYPAEAVEPVPAALKAKRLRSRTDGLWEVDEACRRLVAFRELNLIGPWPMRGAFDVVFCRNVVIYFDDATQERIWDRFVSVLKPGGALYVGHSERVTGPAAARLRSTGLTAYELGSGR